MSSVIVWNYIVLGIAGAMLLYCMRELFILKIKIICFDTITEVINNMEFNKK